jgi:DNA polymerase III subunit delta'
VPFRDLIDQQHARILLQSALRSGRIAHAYLFVGPSGVGRLAAAHAFAQALLCASAGDDACGLCGPCRKVAAGTHPDLRIISPGGGDGGGERRAVAVRQVRDLKPEASYPRRTDAGVERRAVAIDQVRDLKQEAAYPPYEGKWKVFILEDAEQMRAEAANSLLKVLEEPPPGIVIILLAESIEALLPTLISRSQIVRFTLVPAPDIAQALVERAALPEARARVLAAIAGGRPCVALAAAAAEDEFFARRQEVFSTLRALERGDVIAGLDAAESVLRPPDRDEEKEGRAKAPRPASKEEIERWLDIALWWYRDLAIWQATRDPALLTNLDSVDEIAAWAGRVTPGHLQRVVEAIEQTKAALRRNINPKLALEWLFMTHVRAAPPARSSSSACPGRPY